MQKVLPGDANREFGEVIAISQFSRKEVSHHSDSKSCWVIIDNVVYDVTSFLSQHPGGTEILLEHAGGDCTSAFNDKGHSKAAVLLLSKYKIGTLQKDDVI